jgi:hypothetical protein
MIFKSIKLAWWYVSHALFLGAGSHKADLMHLDIIEAVLSDLPVNISETVRAQLDRRYFFSWMTNGRINVFFFYDLSELPLIQDPAFDDSMFKVELFVEGRKHVAHVGFYKKRIHCVELKKPRAFFAGKRYLVGAVKEGKPKESFTNVIDRAEHGKETGL